MATNRVFFQQVYYVKYIIYAEESVKMETGIMVIAGGQIFSLFLD